MGAKTIPDSDLLSDADLTTIWIANTDAPKHMWSLREAIGWIMASPDPARISLHRPARGAAPSAWLKPDQIARLWLGLTEAPSAIPGKAA